MTDDTPNGTHYICSACGTGYGYLPKEKPRTVKGVCAICGETTQVSNALHDYSMDDDDVTWAFLAEN